MNSTIEILKGRSSIRKFKPDMISDEHLNEIKACIKRSPTAGNMQDFFVIMIKDKAKLEKLSVLCDNQPLIKHAPMALIFVSDPTKHLRTYELNDIDIDKYNLPTMGHLKLGLIDTVIAAQTAAVACDSLGIGNCYIGDIVENKEEVMQLLNLDKYQIPITMLSIGYFDQERKLRERNDDKFYFYDEEYNKPTNDEIKQLFDQDVPKRYRDQYKNFSEFQFNYKVNTEFFKEMTRSVTKYFDDFR